MTSSIQKTFFVFCVLVIGACAFYVRAEEDAATLSIFVDADQDGLSDTEERTLKTDPQNADSDGDGYKDGIEVESGYDPLKAAPGDALAATDQRLVTTGEQKQTATVTANETNSLTDQVSQVVADVINTSSSENSDVKLEDLNGSLEELLSKSVEDVVLPEVDRSEIKVSKEPCKGSSESCTEKRREQVLAYITTVLYMVNSNSPYSWNDTEDATNQLESLIQSSSLLVSDGNFQGLDDVTSRGQKLLDDLRAVEVPEGMVETHIKGLMLAKYAVSLKDELKRDTGDPFGQLSSIAKAQGLFSISQDFLNDLNAEVEKYGITEIPIDL